MDYGTVEAAVFAAIGAKKRDHKILRARLLHLRNNGIPAGIEKPGSGRKVQYTLKQAFQMLIGLRLELAGLTPRIAVKYAPSIEKYCRRYGGGFQVVIDAQAEALTMSGLGTPVQETGAVIVVNLGALIRPFSEHMRRADGRTKDAQNTGVQV